MTVMPRAVREGLGVRVRSMMVCFLVARQALRRVRPRPVVAPAKATVTIVGFGLEFGGFGGWAA